MAGKAEPKRGGGGLRMAARGIKSSSSLVLDMKATIALDGVHKVHREWELL